MGRRVKRCDHEAEQTVERRVEGFRYGTCRTPAIRWLATRRDATFDSVRRERPLEPPRTSWLGPRHCLFREFTEHERDSILAAATGRLEAFARARDASVVILTYRSSTSSSAAVSCTGADRLGRRRSARGASPLASRRPVPLRLWEAQARLGARSHEKNLRGGVARP